MQLLAILAAFVAIVAGQPKYTCRCTDDGNIELTWKNFGQNASNQGYMLQLYVLPKGSGSYVPPCPKGGRNPLACYPRIDGHKVVDDAGLFSMRLQTKVAFNPSYQSIYCILTRQPSFAPTPTILDSRETTCVAYPPLTSGNVPPTPQGETATLKVVFFALAAVIGFLLLVLVSTVRLIRYMKSKKEQNPYSTNVIESTDGGGAIELDQMNAPAAYTTVQMFPSHPMMMQTQPAQVYQDPLATLAPVYTATYVQPGIH